MAIVHYMLLPYLFQQADQADNHHHYPPHQRTPQLTG